MTQPNENVPADDLISNDGAAVPGFPKTLTPYRHKLAESAAKINMVMRGKSGLTQAQQVAILTAVNAELRKMVGGAAKALEIAQGRDYEAYKEAKEAVKKGKITAAEKAQFDALTAGLGGGEYDFDGLLDEISEEAAAQAAIDLPGEQTDDEPPTA